MPLRPDPAIEPAIGPALEPTFQPRPLEKKALEVPITAGLRLFPQEEREKIRAEQVAWHRQFELGSPEARRKMARYAVAAAISVSLLNMFVYAGIRVGPGWHALWVQLPLLALYGAWFARTQPSPFLGGVALGAIFVVCCLAGWPDRHAFGMIFIGWFHFLLGMVAAVMEASNRAEGMR